MHRRARALSLLSFAALLPSAAAAGPCDKPILRAEGRMSGWGYAPACKGMVARRFSVRRWESTAAELHGATYARWANAKGRKIDCEPYRDHPWLKGLPDSHISARLSSPETFDALKEAVEAVRHRLCDGQRRHDT